MSIQKTLLFTLCLFFLATGFAHAALVTVDDSYGIPASRVLLVEPFGVLDNDTLDGENAGENGVTATLLTDVSKGTLACPGVSPGLCPNGSFEYTPGTGFDGTDSFVYQAVSVSTSEISPPTTVTLTACTGGPTVFTCWLETSYLNKLSELGYNNDFLESFEGTVWDIARSPTTAPSIVSNGVTWTTNHPTTNEISTSSGAARTGAWGVYDPDHGYATGTVAECDVDNPPVHCLPYDGFSGSIPGPDVLYGVGGYISGFIGANVDIILDGTPHNAGKVTDGYHFMGVIDMAGFNAFEYREVDGKVGQLLYIFGDDFTIATSGTTVLDSDNDGLPDAYETQYAFLDPLDDTDAALDQDSDGLSNLDEYISGTQPDNPDTDADGRIDGLDSEPLVPAPNLCGGDNVVLINDVYANGTIFDCRAQVSIRTEGAVTIEAGANVLYMAPVLRLDTGFSVEVGGVFHAVGATTVAP